MSDASTLAGPLWPASIRDDFENRSVYRARELLNELADPVRGSQPHHKRLHRRVIAILVATLVLDVFASALIYLFHGIENSRSLNALANAAVWSSSQLLAGGSSLSVTSWLAHVLEVALELWAITAVAALAASVTVFLHHSDTLRHE